MNTIAYCFGYGAILTKMGRVYKIFHNPSAKKNQIVSSIVTLVLITTVIQTYIMPIYFTNILHRTARSQLFSFSRQLINMKQLELFTYQNTHVEFALYSCANICVVFLSSLHLYYRV